MADDFVDREFGSGAVKITPGHDPADFECGQRLGLPSINILRPDGTLNENAGPYADLTVAEARKRVEMIAMNPSRHAGTGRREPRRPGRSARAPGGHTAPIAARQVAPRRRRNPNESTSIPATGSHT